MLNLNNVGKSTCKIINGKNKTKNDLEGNSDALMTEFDQLTSPYNCEFQIIPNTKAEREIVYILLVQVVLVQAVSFNYLTEYKKYKTQQRDIFIFLFNS